jgi:O-antigen/teichoic acid export membrane protein
MNVFEKQPDRRGSTSPQLFEKDRSNLFPIDEFPTQVNIPAVNIWGEEDSRAVDKMATWLLPAISLQYAADTIPPKSSPGIVASKDGFAGLLLNLIKSSGVYAIASVAVPLVSLAIAPFLTHSLSPADYGILTLLNTFIGLWAGITQLGLTSAFFRGYNYDYSSPRDKRGVLATSTMLLFLVSILTTIGAVTMAPFIAKLLFGRSSLGNLVTLAAGVVLAQNLTVPGFCWLRGEGRALPYALLSIVSLLINLFTTVICVKMLNLGVAGSLIGTGCGYAGVAICTLPIVLIRAGIKLRIDIARNLLAFGLPLVLNFTASWVLQLVDRFLLSVYGSLAQVARYSVVYTLGSALTFLVLVPFLLAWSTSIFAIAKRKDAVQVFQQVFRWFSMFLLLAAFGLSLVGTIVLELFFPVTYHSAAPIIPIVAASNVFYGICYIFMVGASIQRKTWLTAVFTTIAAIANVALNLFLIPVYGAMGAAVATLLAYIVLACSAYIVNQKIYPIPFEIGMFCIGLLLGSAFYMTGNFLAQAQEIYIAWGIYFAFFVLYGICLACLGLLMTRSHKYKIQQA